MRIALLTTYLALGENTDSGIGQHYRILAEALSAQQHEVTVFYLCEPAAAEAAHRELVSMNKPWACVLVKAPLPALLTRLLRSSWPARQLCSHLWLAHAACRSVLAAHDDRPFAIIETHSYNLPAFFLLLTRKRPLVLTRVSTTLSQMLAISPMQSRVLAWEAALERWATRHSDALVTHTAHHRDTVCSEENHSREQFHLVPHGLPDPGEPSPSREPDDVVEFLYVGRFETRKGIDVLLAAIPIVAAACPHAVFTLAGAQGDETLWRDFSKQHPELAAGRMRALGRVPSDKLVELYQRCSVVVAPSRYESFGLIYVEGMSHGKPVIGCNAGGIPNVVTANVTGLLAAPGDIASLVACMLRLGNDGHLRRRMGEAGRRDFLDRFSATAMARQSAGLYQRLREAASRQV